LPTSPLGMRSADATALSQQIQESDDFGRACMRFCQSLNVPWQDAEGFGMEVCSLCWSQGRSALCAGDKDVSRLQKEVETLQGRLAACNLTAMKQMSAAKVSPLAKDSAAHVGVMHSEPKETAEDKLDMDMVTFHEPLSYLDPVNRELVLEIVCEKLRQLQDGTAPPYFLELLKDSFNLNKGARPGKRGSGGDEDDAETDEDTKEKMKDMMLELEDLRMELQKAEKKSFHVKKELTEARRTIEMATQTAEEAKQMRDVAVQQCEAAMADVKEQESVLAERTEELKEAAAKILTFEKETQTLQEEIRLLKEQMSETEKAHEAERQSQEERQREELKTVRFAAEAAGEAARKEAAAKQATSDARARGCQTTMTGSNIDDQEAELKKMRVMLEEMQMKVKDVVKRARDDGLGETVEQYVNDVGLGGVLSHRTVFERLYKDALERVHRLEDLRARINKERSLVASCGVSPEVWAAFSQGLLRPPTSLREVLEAIERGSILGLKRFSTRNSHDEAVVPQQDGVHLPVIVPMVKEANRNMNIRTIVATDGAAQVEALRKAPQVWYGDQMTAAHEVPMNSTLWRRGEPLSKPAILKKHEFRGLCASASLPALQSRRIVGVSMVSRPCCPEIC